MPTENLRSLIGTPTTKVGTFLFEFATPGIGHILNLGHGILQQTPVENARAFVNAGQNAPVTADVRSERAH